MTKTGIAAFFSGLLLGILVLIFATALGLGIIHLTDFPYTLGIDALNIEESSGLNREEILINYNAVMDFLSPFSNAEFDLPSLNYSAEGASHFDDCKPIFNGIYLLGALSGVALLILAITKKKTLSSRVLRVSAVITVTIPALLSAAVFISFDKTFELFHKIFFDGDTWLFNPLIDEVINILPADFFMHCAMFIVAMWLVAALLQYILARKIDKARVL